MKLRLLLLFIFSAFFQLKGQMLITGVVDGPLTGGVPKAVELYVYEDIADLSIYGVGFANNGGGTDGEEFTFPTGANANAGDFIYIASEEPGFLSFFGFAPDYTDGDAAINGDDAIELFKDGTVIDVLGDISVDGTGEPWDHMDGWAYRKNNSGPDGTTFVLANWTFSGINQLEGGSTNLTCSSPFPIGTYSYGTVSIPTAPVAIAATNLTHESFSANWDASTGASTYYLDVSEANDFSAFVSGYENLNVGNVTTYGVSGLNSSNDYYYRVRANNSAGTSDNSNSIMVSTSAIPNTSVQFSSTSGSVLETAGIYNISVSINYPDPTAATSVDVLLFDGTGDASDISNYTTQTITFNSGSSSDQILPLTITDDGVSEGNENLIFKLVNPSGGNSANVGSNAEFTLTIIEPAGGTYYDEIDPNLTTFVDDLKNRIRDPYTWVPYSQHDETNIANFASIDNGDGTKSVFCVYSNYEYVYSGTFSWIPLSREHTFPHSWMPTNPADQPIERDEYADQHHLFPAHQDFANAVRSNHPLGNVTNSTDTFGEAKFGTDDNGNTVYEPRDEHKGDAARAILYMIVRYDDIEGYDWGLSAINAASTRDPQDLQVLLDWHNQDPPSLWEISRNDYTQSIQGNRNPFVDHPEYVEYIDFNTVDYVSKNLFFSEYLEGSSNNKALEIFNNTGLPIDLGSNEYKIQIYSNGSNTATSAIDLTGTIADNDVFVIANTSSDDAILAVADLTSGSVNFNGDDAVALLKGTEIVDVIGQIGVDPGSEWGSGIVTTLNHTIRRKASIGVGDADGSDAFDPSIEWNGYAIDVFGGLGTHAINTGPPTIANITRLPNIPTASENTVISASVTDDASVGTVKVIYTINGGSENELIMTNTTGSIYSGTIPNSAYNDGSLLEYWIYSEDEDGASSKSSHQKVFTGTTPIANLKELDSDLRLVHLQTYARIIGVATVESGLFSTSSLDVYIQDNNSAINLFKQNETINIVRGNNYIIEGKLDQYYGKAEIVPDDLLTDITDGGTGSLPKAILLKSNGVGEMPDPTVMTIGGFLTNPEAYEGMLVGIQHLSNTDAGDSWPSTGNNANVEVTDDGGTTKLTLRIDKDSNLDESIEPTWAKDVVGIFTQYDISPPYNWGYQIQPRDMDDIQADGALPVELTSFAATVYENKVNLIWETATEVNNYGFRVERKKVTQAASATNDKPILDSWEEITFLKGNGNSNSPKHYSYSDESITGSGKYSYRLKQIDIDGKFEYSNVIEVEVGIPVEFEVAQNYPNPFNPSTTISFSIPDKSDVSVQIYNVLGEVVHTLVNEQLEAGNYKYNFNASSISSGTYIYRVTAGTNIETKKMILLK